jgi:ATP synthase I chain
MRDVLLDRLQRSAIVVCAILTIGAVAITRGNWRAGLSVVGGGLLIGISFVSIRSSIEELAALAGGRRAGAPRPKIARMLAKLAGRYALLGFLAYVMIARLRLHPLGLVAGASSVVAAAALEAGRLLWKKT